MNTRILPQTGGIFLCFAPSLRAQKSVARQFNEDCLDAIRTDFPAPTIHARNLFHFSAAMYDAWATYDENSVGLFHNEIATAANLPAARSEAVSYAAYRILKSRYSNSPNAAATLAALDLRMATLGFDTEVTSTSGDSPAAVGNRCAAAVFFHTLDDGANEVNGYASTAAYHPVNQPLILPNSGTGVLVDANRWQPLAFNHINNSQSFLTPHWKNVTPWALFDSYDPGPPPYLGGEGDLEFKNNNLEVIQYSALLDPDTAGLIDISPASLGNSQLGTNDGTGHGVNPVTGSPYAPNIVNHGDFGRVLAEFWADGPNSETPPGHWNALTNQVADPPRIRKAH
ncbi:hypothetical protein V2O64_18570 [Verrucomicrobiaceae bacterium 227]